MWACVFMFVLCRAHTQTHHMVVMRLSWKLTLNEVEENGVATERA